MLQKGYKPEYPDEKEGNQQLIYSYAIKFFNLNLCCDMI
jgi:hypothetical protein